MNKNLIKKYEEALLLSTKIEKLKCHTLGIQNIIDKLKTEGYKINTLDEVWVDYFLSSNNK